MGYTHYYRVARKYDEKRWGNLIKDVKKLLELPPPEYLSISWQSGEPYQLQTLDDIINSGSASGYYNIDETEISFNGIGEGAHEQFQLYQRMPPEVFERHEDFNKRTTDIDFNHPYFEFTKTARKPYDVVVCCCLILAKMHLRKNISITSDGGLEDGWEAAIKIINDNFSYKTKWDNHEQTIDRVDRYG